MKKSYLVPAAGIALVCALGAWTAIASALVTITTEPATNITSTDATLNAMNGGTAATDSSFWVSTSTFSTASTTIPAGVYSTADLGPQTASSSFSAQLSSALGMPAVMPNTTYHFVAWISTDGGSTWTPGSELNFTTGASSSSAPTVTNVSPTSGSTSGGTSVTVTGTNLTGATAVDFGSTPATGVTVSSSTSLTAIAPAKSAGTVDVTVVTPGGTSATSSNDKFTYTTSGTTTPLSISNVNVSTIGSSSATITWTTNLAADSRANYGTTTSYGSTASDATATTSHSLTLTNLSEATLYHFNVQSSEATSTATSSDMTFITGSTASTTPLAIDGITAVKSSGLADNSFIDGWEWTIHFTVPTNENAFRIRFSDWGNASSSFPTAGNVRVSSPESTNASSSASGIIESDNGYSGWLYLNGDTSTSTPGRQVDLEVDVKIPFGTPAQSFTSNFTAESCPSSATSTAPCM